MAFAETNPDALAKKFFVIVMFGVVAYVGFVIAMMSAPDKAEADSPDHGVVVSMAHR